MDHRPVDAIPVGLVRLSAAGMSEC